MKMKEYKAPEMEVIKMKYSQPLLDGSITDGSGSEGPGTDNPDVF